MTQVAPETLRDAMERFPTGVTVVTAVGPSGPAGATANAVVSLSLEPPMMLACLDLGSRTLVAVEHARIFGINILAGELAEVHDGGDHSIVTGTVIELEARGGEPLLFLDGDYRPLG